MEKKRPYTSPETIVFDTVCGTPLTGSDVSLDFSNTTSTNEALGREGGGWIDDEKDNRFSGWKCIMR